MTQHDIVMNHIKSNGSISPFEAILDHGITRLAARIHELKEMGHDFRTEMRTNPTTGKRYARYYLN